MERRFLHTLKTLPPKSQLMVVDDGTDALSSKVIERLAVRNPGIIAVKPREVNRSPQAPAGTFPIIAYNIQIDVSQVDFSFTLSCRKTFEYPFWVAIFFSPD